MKDIARKIDGITTQPAHQKEALREELTSQIDTLNTELAAAIDTQLAGIYILTGTL